MVILMNFPPPSEGIHHSEPNVTAHYKNRVLGKGVLYISESVLCWISSSGEGFSLQYPSIFMHAVSRDLTHFPQECLYLMIDGKIKFWEEEEEEPNELSNALNSLSVGDGQASVPLDSSAANNFSAGDGQVAAEPDSIADNLSVEDESDVVQQDYDEPTAEIRFVPDNIIMLDIMFQALSDCQTLNPEPGELDAGDAVIAPPFIVRDQNGFTIEFEECEDIEEEPMNEEQFEDAEG